MFTKLKLIGTLLVVIMIALGLFYSYSNSAETNNESNSEFKMIPSEQQGGVKFNNL